MTPLQQIAARAPLDLRGATLEAFNVERVRGYLENHLGCSQKETARATNLNRRTVAKAVRIIRNEKR